MNSPRKFIADPGHEHVPRVELWTGLELAMSRPGCPTHSVFLTPQQALQLAEILVAEARRELARKGMA